MIKWNLPYGWGAAPYLGSAKSGAGLPLPLDSFLWPLESKKKKHLKISKRQSHTLYKIIQVYFYTKKHFMNLLKLYI